jgi:hypothetical protein
LRTGAGALLHRHAQSRCAQRNNQHRAAARERAQGRPA